MTIDIYTDIVCPWCSIGVKRLERALQAKLELEVARKWRPFQLRPELPPGGQDWQRFAEEKFGGLARAQAAFAHVARLGEEEGILFRFDHIANAPNTAQAHRLILLAQEHGREWRMAERLFQGYFAEGRNLSRLEHLVEIAGKVGLEDETVEAYLQGDAGKEAVEESQRRAQRYGISGVPFYIIGNHGGNRYGISGAQPPQVFLRVFNELAAAKA